MLTYTHTHICMSLRPQPSLCFTVQLSSLHNHSSIQSKGSSVSIVTRLQADDRASIPGRGKEGTLSSSPPRPDRFYGSPTFQPDGYRGHFTRDKAARSWSWRLTST